MSAPGNEKTPANPAKPAQEPDFYPPPPPGPPPGHAAAHSNATPIPEYNIPAYDPSKLAHDPSKPTFAPPPRTESDIYDASPIKEHAPQLPTASHQQPQAHQPHQAPQQHQAHQQEQQQSHQGESKSSWANRLSGWGAKAAVPFNALANKVGSETFLPTTMDKECEKAARILKSFCKDGIYVENNERPTTPNAPNDKPADASKSKSKSLLTIPSKVIARAHGLAIFTTVRAGFHVTGASGSGVLIARLPDGSWSPPSGIQVHSVGAGFVIGLDIYDCVVVINTKEALEAFTRTRMSLGSDLAVTAGPWGAGGSLDWGVPQGKGKEKATEGAAAPATNPDGAVPVPAPGQEAQAGKDGKSKASALKEVLKPVYSYVKSRGFYAGVQIDGTVVTERKDANAAFYGAPVAVDKILHGDVPLVPSHAGWPATVRGLFEVLKGAEGWRGQSPAPPPNPPPSAVGVAGVTTGVSQMNLGSGPSSIPPPPPAQPVAAPASSVVDSKMAEARAHEERSEPPPPSYTPPTGTEELPPAYVDDGHIHPGVGDHKTN